MKKLASIALVLGFAAVACSAPESRPPSVKPGINESFLDPDLDVAEFTDRFEGESREVWVERHAISDAVGLKPGAAVADVGAGTGLFLELFAKAVGPRGRVYALDISPGFVDHLNERAHFGGYDQVVARLCSDSSIRLPDQSIDVAFLCDVYHHFEYPAQTMQSVYAALRPGGEVVVVDFERVPGVTREWLLDHVRAGKAEVLAELDSFGFDLVEEIELPGLAENYIVRLRKR